MVQLVSDYIKNFWNTPGLRGLFLLSFILQIILFLFGILRKYYNPRPLIRTIIIWCVYNLAYAIIPTALTITAQTTSDMSSRELMSFWASLLFLHLGGPDTFTGYSMEDNELWLRNLMIVVSQSVLSFNIILMSFPGSSHLPWLSLLVYFAGCIKCYGRVQALRKGSTEYLRWSMCGNADAGPDFVKFMEDHGLKTKQGFRVKVDQLAADHVIQVNNAGPENPIKKILEAYSLFNRFKRLFVDLTLTYEDKDISTLYFGKLDSAAAFRVVEIELGFAFDKRYTKANVVYTSNGLILQTGFVFFILLVPVGFYFMSDIRHYQAGDIIVTYLVIVAEILKEIIAFYIVVRSDWTDVWLNQHNRTRDIFKLKCLNRPTKQRWSNSIPQLDMLSVALEEKPTRFLAIQKMLGVDEELEKERYQTFTQVSDNLKDMIFTQFNEFMSNNKDKPLSVHRGSYTLQKNKCTSLLWSVNEVEFDQSVLIWNIATSLCFWSTVDDESGVNRIESNHISKYLLALLISNPEMLPDGNGMTRYRDTCADANRFFKNKGVGVDKVTACKNLLRVEFNGVLPSEVIGDRSKTVLFDGVRLAQDLLKMNEESMWKVISEVWIEILGYAAGNCKGLPHSQQLGRGGQLLTHVWFLMAQLGLTEHFQVCQGHARAKLNVS